MIRGVVIGWALLAACGRIGFDPTGDGGASGDSLDPPALARRAYLKAPSPQLADEFGHAVAISGDGNVAAVGSPLGENGAITEAGLVQIFRRTGDRWSSAETLFASNPDMFDQFGWAVSLSGDGKTLAVGARREDSGGNPADDSVMTAGAVYVFADNAGVLVEQAYVKPTLPDVDDAFGENVALSADGNTLAVAAFYEDSASRVINSGEADNTAGDAGAVYIFTRVGATWPQQAYIKASNADAGDGFGIGVSLSGDGNTLAVGAYREDSATGSPGDNSLTNPGAAYIFTRSVTTWTEAAYLKPPTPENGANFGYSLALSSDGTHLAVGSIGSLSSSGSVFLFTGGGSVWNVPKRYGETTPGNLDQLGFDTAISSAGTRIAAGALEEDGPNDALSNSGAVYLFATNPPPLYLRSATADADDQFGWSVDLSASGNALIIGAPFEDSDAIGVDGNANSNAIMDSGAAYIFY